MFLKYIFSLHYFPLVFSFPAAFAGLLTQTLGCKQSFGLCCLGMAISATAFTVLPLLTFRVSGGMYNVGIRELKANIERGEPPVTIFYPIPKTGEEVKPVWWLPFNDLRFLEGMARYVCLPPFLLRDLEFVRATMVENAEVAKDSNNFPLVVFSHGLGGYARLYTLLLINLAARGVIIAAPTHMDGSAAFCRDEKKNVELKLDTTKGPVLEDRAPQLLVRVKELQATLKRFTQTNEILEAIGFTPEETNKLLKANKKVTLVGHSFGAATTMKTALAVETKNCGDVCAVVALDPWHVPLTTSLFYEPIVEGKEKYCTPSLVYHSEGWVRWEESWDFFSKLEPAIIAQKFSAEETQRLEEATAKSKSIAIQSWYNTFKCGGTGHLSYTDMALLSPVVFKKSFMTAKPEAQIVEWSTAIWKFASEQRAPLPPAPAPLPS